MKITYVVLYVTLILFSACEPKEKINSDDEKDDEKKELKLHLKGEIFSNKNGKVYLYKDNGKKNVLIDSTTIKGGLFSFKKDMDYSPQYIAIKFAPDLNLGNYPYDLIVDANTVGEIKFYPKDNYVKKKGEHSSPLDSLTKIGFYSDSVFWLIVGKYAQVHSPEYEWKKLLRNEENQIKMDSLNRLISKNESNVDNFFDSTINCHKDNALSSIVLNKLYLRLDLKSKEAKGKTTIIDLNKLTAYYDLLSKKVKHIEISKQINDKIIIEKKTIAGSEILDFRSFLENGDEIHPSDFRGKITLIDFWASWCVPCRKQFSGLKEIYQKFNLKGFEIYAISVDKDRDKWIKASAEENIQWVNTIKHIDENINGDLFGAPYVPFSILIDEKGKIIGKNIKKDELETILAKRLL